MSSSMQKGRFPSVAVVRGPLNRRPIFRRPRPNATAGKRPFCIQLNEEDPSAPSLLSTPRRPPPTMRRHQ